MRAVKDDYEFVVSLFIDDVFSGLASRGGGVWKKGGEKWESIRKASIVSIMESNWRASEDAWSRVPFVMGDAAGGIMSEDVVFNSPFLCVCVCVCMANLG